MPNWRRVRSALPSCWTAGHDGGLAESQGAPGIYTAVLDYTDACDAASYSEPAAV